MKYSTGILTAVTLIAAFILSGCDSPSNRTQDSETSAIETDRNSEMATNNEVEAELRTYRAEYDEKEMEFNRTISEIKQEIENEPDEEVRAELEEKLDEVEASHRELKREMDNYKASGRDDWDEFKDSFSDRMDDLGDSLENFFSDINTNTSTN